MVCLPVGQPRAIFTQDQYKRKRPRALFVLAYYQVVNSIIS